ncbi:N-acetyltransferase 9 [Mortierella alpina]|nr:N-acetyltransferase 9 [Mortierella alpina]
MRANERTVLVGDKCVLVPYLKRHVDHYNKWMQSPELLEMTASEPLTLEEEYEMQESWRVDENKCTFIILAKTSSELEITAENALAQKMVGDVNLFFNDHDDPHSAEIEIMIAEPTYRRKGMGLEAIRMMITYAYESLGTKRITAKISTENEGSIQLFLTQLGFNQIGYSKIFEEVTLERILSSRSASPSPSKPSQDLKDKKKGEVFQVEDNDEYNEEGFGQPVLTHARFETLELNPEDVDHD